MANSSTSQTEPRIQFDRNALAELCRRHHIVKLSFFGSVLTDAFQPESDVDVLVEFDEQFPVGFRIFKVEDELSQLLGGRRIDLLDPEFLNRHIASEIIEQAEVQYEAANGHS